jgi:hypothetical protein
MDDDFGGGESEAFSVCSSPLSDHIDIVVLKASSRATDGNTVSFNGTESTEPKYVHSGDKTYLAIDHTTNIRGLTQGTQLDSLSAEDTIRVRRA